MSSNVANWSVANWILKCLEAYIKARHGPNATVKRWPTNWYRKNNLSVKWEGRVNDLYKIGGYDRNRNKLSYTVLGVYGGAEKDRVLANEALHDYLSVEDKVFGVYNHEDDGNNITTYLASSDTTDEGVANNEIEIKSGEKYKTPALEIPLNWSGWKKSHWIIENNIVKKKKKLNTKRTAEKQEWEVVPISDGFRQLHDEGGLPHKFITDSYNPQWNTLASRMPEINKYLKEGNEEVMIAMTKKGKMVLCIRQL